MKKTKEINIINHLFICIIINLIPIIMLGVFQVSQSLYSKMVYAIFCIQTIIMIFAIRQKIFYISNKKIYLLLLFIIIQIGSQAVMYLIDKHIELLDIINILCVALNFFIFVICVPKFEVKKQDIIEFMKKMVILGVIACIYNIVINGLDMIHLSKLDSSYSASFSSFFSNRNQFGIFVLICIISNLYLKNINKKRYLIINLLFIINLILTMSRTSIMGLVLIYVIKYYLDFKKISKKQIFNFIIILLLITLVVVYLCISTDIVEVFVRLFIRKETLETASGRTEVWKNGLKIALDRNILTGVGRFKAIEINQKEYASTLNQFHNMYIETFVSFGISGLIIFLTFLIAVLKIVKHSNCDNKNIIIATFVTFLFVLSFESFCKFSAGYVDTIFIIYLFSIPLLLSKAN